MNFKRINEQLQKFLEDNLSEFQKMDKFCDLDVSRTNMERHIGKDENGYAIFAWDRTSQKFDGSYNHGWVRKSPYFQSEEEVIQWFADGLLKHTDMDDIIEGWKDGSFEIYDDRLIKLLKLDDIKPGKYESPSMWPTGEFKDRLVPTYLTMPKGPQRNNARIEYIKQHGKPSELEESLNEELEKFIVNEISDELKGRYIQGRQAQVDAALAKLNKARGQVKKSDARQIATLPEGIDKETATDALQYLKSEMRRIDSGSDWRLEEQDNQMCLSVRYWGSWHGDDGSGDYDWQKLDDNYRDKLDGILTKVQKEYGVQIYEPGSEKNWLDFCIPITKMTKKSTMDYEDEKAWKEFLDKVRGTDITGPIQKKRGKLVAELPWIGKGDYALHINPVEGGYTCFIRSPRGVYEPLRIKEVCSFKDILNKILDFYQTTINKQKQRTGREYLGDNTYKITPKELGKILREVSELFEEEVAKNNRAYTERGDWSNLARFTNSVVCQYANYPRDTKDAETTFNNIKNGLYEIVKKHGCNEIVRRGSYDLFTLKTDNDTVTFHWYPGGSMAIIIGYSMSIYRS